MLLRHTVNTRGALTQKVSSSFRGTSMQRQVSCVYRKGSRGMGRKLSISVYANDLNKWYVACT